MKGNTHTVGYFKHPKPVQVHSWKLSNVCVRVCMYVYKCIHTKTCTYMYVSTCVCAVYISVYIHIFFPEVLLAYIHTHTHPFFPLIFQFNKNEADQHKGNSFMIFLKAFHNCSCTAWVFQQALQACPNFKVPHPSHSNHLVGELAINK